MCLLGLNLDVADVQGLNKRKANVAIPSMPCDYPFVQLILSIILYVMACHTIGATHFKSIFCMYQPAISLVLLSFKLKYLFDAVACHTLALLAC